MGVVNIDFTGASSEWALIDAGVHPADVIRGEFKNNRNNDRMLVLTFGFTEPELAKDKRQLKKNYNITPNDLWRLKEELVTGFGFSAEDLAGNLELEGEGNTLTDERIIHQPVNVEVLQADHWDHKPGDGCPPEGPIKQQNDIGKVMPAGQGSW